MLLQRFTWLGLIVVLFLSRNALAQSKESAFNVRHLLSNQPHGDLTEINWIRIALMPLGLHMASWKR